MFNIVIQRRFWLLLLVLGFIVIALTLSHTYLHPSSRGLKHKHNHHTHNQQSSKPDKWSSVIPNNFSVTICAIALKEELYIEEWIAYHEALGFNHIYLYDNSENNTLQFLAMKYHVFVTVIHYPGRGHQITVYNEHHNRFKNERMWTLFMDVDEFVVLRRHRYIKDYIVHRVVNQTVVDDTKMKLGMILINWAKYGDNNQTKYHKAPVVQRFTTRHPIWHKWGKSIAYLPYVHGIVQHCSSLNADVFSVDGDGRGPGEPFVDCSGNSTYKMNETGEQLLFYFPSLSCKFTVFNNSHVVISPQVMTQ